MWFSYTNLSSFNFCHFHTNYATASLFFFMIFKCIKLIRSLCPCISPPLWLEYSVPMVIAWLFLSNHLDISSISCLTTKNKVTTISQSNSNMTLFLISFRVLSLSDIVSFFQFNSITCLYPLKYSASRSGILPVPFIYLE